MPKKKTKKYYKGVGRRKTAVARVRLFPKEKAKFEINGRTLKDYFPTLKLQNTATASLREVNCLSKLRASVLVKGGGLHSQAEAIRHGTARALVIFDKDFREKLKRAGFLTRDPRAKERKKFGLKRARRAPQWQKR